MEETRRLDELIAKYLNKDIDAYEFANSYLDIFYSDLDDEIGDYSYYDDITYHIENFDYYKTDNKMLDNPDELYKNVKEEYEEHLKK